MIMFKGKLKIKNYKRIIALALLMNFLIFPIYAEPPIVQVQNMKENETKLYNDLEVDILVDELTEAALQAIEKAAGEAARAAFLQSVEREAEAMREAQKYKTEAELLRQAGIKNNVVVGVVCFLGGVVVGSITAITMIK